MPTRTARPNGTGKPTRARKGRKSTTFTKITRATSARDKFHRIAAEPPVDDEAYLRDEAILSDVMAYISLEERREIGTYELASVAISCGTPNFRAELLPLLGRAMRNRKKFLWACLDKTLPKLLDGLVEDTAFVEARVRRRVLDHYWGDMRFESVLKFVGEELAFLLRAQNAIAKNATASFQTFEKLYAERAALLAGIYSVIAQCVDLGADLNVNGDTVREIEQNAWLKVWTGIDDWSTKGSAAITTRLFAHGQWQARAWRTTRLRQRERFISSDEYAEHEAAYS